MNSFPSLRSLAMSFFDFSAESFAASSSRRTLASCQTKERIARGEGAVLTCYVITSLKSIENVLPTEELETLSVQCTHGFHFPKLLPSAVTSLRLDVQRDRMLFTSPPAASRSLSCPPRPALSLAPLLSPLRRPPTSYPLPLSPFSRPRAKPSLLRGRVLSPNGSIRTTKRRKTLFLPVDVKKIDVSERPDHEKVGKLCRCQLK